MTDCCCWTGWTVLSWRCPVQWKASERGCRSVWTGWTSSRLCVCQGMGRGSARWSSLNRQERVIVSQTNIGIISKAMLGKLPRDGVERVWAFPSAWIPSWTKLKCVCVLCACVCPFQVDLYLKEILNDLLKNLTSNQWRIRESSCNAVTDLLRGRQLDSIVDCLPELWEQCLRVRDDIKVVLQIDVRHAASSNHQPALPHMIMIITMSVYHVLISTDVSRINLNTIAWTHVTITVYFINPSGINKVYRYLLISYIVY